jgi:hypothetical protein
LEKYVQDKDERDFANRIHDLISERYHREHPVWDAFADSLVKNEYQNSIMRSLVTNKEGRKYLLPLMFEAMDKLPSKEIPRFIHPLVQNLKKKEIVEHARALPLEQLERLHHAAAVSNYDIQYPLGQLLEEKREKASRLSLLEKIRPNPENVEV